MFPKLGLVVNYMKNLLHHFTDLVQAFDNGQYVARVVLKDPHSLNGDGYI